MASIRQCFQENGLAWLRGDGIKADDYICKALEAGRGDWISCHVAVPLSLLAAVATSFFNALDYGFHFIIDPFIDISKGEGKQRIIEHLQANGQEVLRSIGRVAIGFFLTLAAIFVPSSTLSLLKKRNNDVSEDREMMDVMPQIDEGAQLQRQQYEIGVLEQQVQGLQSALEEAQERHRNAENSGNEARQALRQQEEVSQTASAAQQAKFEVEKDGLQQQIHQLEARWDWIKRLAEQNPQDEKWQAILDRMNRFENNFALAKG